MFDEFREEADVIDAHAARILVEARAQVVEVVLDAVRIDHGGAEALEGAVGEVAQHVAGLQRAVQDQKEGVGRAFDLDPATLVALVD